MIRQSAIVLFIAFNLLTAGAARGAAPFDFEGVTVTDVAGQQITECQPGQELRYNAVYSLSKPGLVLLYGNVTGVNWSQKLDPRIRLRLSGVYTLIWPGSVPLNVNGDARVEVVEYNPLFNELLVRTAFFTVNPFSATYVGSDVCKGCHFPNYTAWQQTKHYPYTGCEICHGPGGVHVGSPSKATIVVDLMATLCKPCHSRNDGNVIEAQDGFIKPQQEYNQWLSTRHGKVMQCAGAGCHNPHYSVQNDPTKAIKKTCTSCHGFKRLYMGMEFVACESCHMAKAVKKDTSTGFGLYRKGDTVSHLWRIKTEAEAYQMFNLGGAVAAKDFKGPFLTVNFSCLTCHNGSDSRIYDFESVQQTSTIVH